MVYRRVRILNDILTNVASVYTLGRFIPVVLSVNKTNKQSVTTTYGDSGGKVSILGGDSIGRCGNKNLL